MSHTRSNWHLALFEKSVLKQAKWRAITAMLGDQTDINGLDLGGDNGVISLLLRQRGGTWCSADLDEDTVASIRSLVGDNVHLTDGRTLPFPDEAFDVVVVIDMLEHVEQDDALIREIHRVLRAGGRLIAIVPHIKRFSLLRRLRLALGLTDEWHGHVRPGYTLADIQTLLRPGFVLRKHRTYNKVFSEFLDIVLNYAYESKARSSAGPSSKGTVVTEKAFARHERTFRLYSRVYPFLWLFVRLDLLAWPFLGYTMIVSADKQAPT
jgi:SAM-dependent methyltransferase